MFKQNLDPIVPFNTTREILSSTEKYPWISEFKRWSTKERTRLRSKLKLKRVAVTKNNYRKYGKGRTFGDWSSAVIADNEQVNIRFEKEWKVHLQHNYPVAYLHEREKDIWRYRQDNGTRLRAHKYPYEAYNPKEDRDYALMLIEQACIHDDSL